MKNIEPRGWFIVGKTYYRIGHKIKFTQYYSKKAGGRFRYSYNGTRMKEPTPEYQHFNEGYIVGVRSVVMSDYTREWLGEEEGYTATGNRETVLLVTNNIYQNPVVVRFCDVIGGEHL